MIVTTATHYQVRHLWPWQLPAEVWPGMELSLDRSWAWGAFGDSEVKAVLLCAPAHGILIMLRLWKAPDASPMIIRQLLREVAVECMADGMKGWMCMVSGVNLQELKLARLMLRYKGIHMPLAGLMGAGRLEELCQR